MIEPAANLKSQIDNKDYVNSNTRTVHVICVQCVWLGATFKVPYIRRPPANKIHADGSQVKGESSFALDIRRVFHSDARGREFAGNATHLGSVPAECGIVR
jgi:hypothetical protein